VAKRLEVFELGRAAMGKWNDMIYSDFIWLYCLMAPCTSVPKHLQDFLFELLAYASALKNLILRYDTILRERLSLDIKVYIAMQEQYLPTGTTTNALPAFLNSSPSRPNFLDGDPQSGIISWPCCPEYIRQGHRYICASTSHIGTCGTNWRQNIDISINHKAVFMPNLSQSREYFFFLCCNIFAAIVIILC